MTERALLKRIARKLAHDGWVIRKLRQPVWGWGTWMRFVVVDENNGCVNYAEEGGLEGLAREYGVN
jgi:hypothetical protein